MKKILGVVLTLAGLLMGVTNAQAVEAIRIWQKASGENFPAFEAAMQQNGWADAVGITTDGLAEAAYDHASKNDLIKFAPETNQAKEPWKGMFRRWHGITGDIVTWEQYRVRGQNVGWYLPIETEEISPASIPLSEAAVKLESLNQTISSLSGQAGENQEAINSVKQELRELRSALGPVTEENASMTGTINDLQMSVYSIENGEQTLAMIETTTAIIDERVQDQLTAIQQLITDEASARANTDEIHDEQIAAHDGRIGVVEGEVETLKGSVAGQNMKLQKMKELGTTQAGKISDLETKVSGWEKLSANVQYFPYIVGIALMLYGLFLGLGWWKFGQRTKANEIVLKGDGTEENPGLEAEVSDVKETLRKQGNRITKLRGDLTSTKNSIVELATVVEEGMKISPNDFKWDDKNATDKELAALSGGREKSVVWKFSHEENTYAVSLWREADTPEGQICSNIVRNVQSGQLVDPITVDNLKQRIASAVMSGRIKPVKSEPAVAIVKK